MVFQEFSLIPQMSVGQNILLTREPKGRLRLIDDREIGRRAQAALGRVGADVDPDRLVEQLPVGSRQLVEIAKAISQDASILILDEPTASLAAAETRTLMAAVRRLTAEGIAVIYISHHLDEVMGICDHVTVLRDGNVTLSVPTVETTLADGHREHARPVARERARLPGPRGRPVRDGRSCASRGLRNDRLRDVSFDLHRGEIVGIAGLLGSGRSELMRAIFGIDRLDAGTIEVDGRHGPHPRARATPCDAGIALVPEDRARAGLVREHSVGQNVLMAAWRQFARCRASSTTARPGGRRPASWSGSTSGRPASTSRCKELSGGNQQKVVVAKNLSVQPSVLLLDDPTVGVDVGSKREILMQVRALAAGGDGIVLVSSEFEELSGVADRVLVIRDGAIVRVLDRADGDDLSEEALSRAVQEQEVSAGIADVISQSIRSHDTGGPNTMTSPMDALRPSQAPGAVAPHGLPARRDTHLRGRPVAQCPHRRHRLV